MCSDVATIAELTYGVLKPPLLCGTVHAASSAVLIMGIYICQSLLPSHRGAVALFILVKQICFSDLAL
jgi:hypothetical protein